MMRITSAALLAILLVAVVWWLPPWATLTLATVAAAIAAGELVRLTATARGPIAPVFIAVVSALACVAFATGEPSATGQTAAGTLTAVLVALPIACGAVALAGGPPGPDAIARTAVSFMAPIYVGLPLGVLAWVRAAYGRDVLLWPILVIAVSDSAQYYTGRALGRRKLAPAISPAKTIEGAIGGLIAAALVGGLVAPHLVSDRVLPRMLASSGSGAALAVALAVAGMLGDLFESFLKRAAGVKDSGALIPGHGGLLDRIDSHLFAAPLYFLVVRYVA